MPDSLISRLSLVSSATAIRDARYVIDYDYAGQRKSIVLTYRGNKYEAEEVLDSTAARGVPAYFERLATCQARGALKLRSNVHLYLSESVTESLRDRDPARRTLALDAIFAYLHQHPGHKVSLVAVPRANTALRVAMERVGRLFRRMPM